jgi:hypothetical protein
MRPLEDGSRADCEVLLASIAAVEATLTHCDPISLRAHYACRAVRPEPRFEVNPRSLLVREHREQLESADCALAHEQIVLKSLTGVKYYLFILVLCLPSLMVGSVQPWKLQVPMPAKN